MYRSSHLVPTSALVVTVLISSCTESRSSETYSDTSEFVGLLPDQIEWIEYEGDGGIRTALLLGDFEAHGPLVARYDIPPNMEIVPHTHREPRSYTVISGTWEIGFGDTFDSEALVPYSQGSYYRLPAGVPHYQRAGPDGAVIQIESIGPDTFDPIE